jgi:hypothetical protein
MISGTYMLRSSRSVQALTLSVLTFLSVLTLKGSLAVLAQLQRESQTPASILAQVRKATGGDGWQHVAELLARRHRAGRRQNRHYRNR